MELKPSDTTHFEQEFIEIENEKVPVSELKTYEGKLLDENNSHVSGAIIEGIFIGTVYSEKDGVYHIESAKRYDIKNGHTIIYHEDDVKSDEEIKRAKRSLNNVDEEDNEVQGVGCGSHRRSVREYMENEQNHLSEELRKKRVIYFSNTGFFLKSDI